MHYSVRVHKCMMTGEKSEMKEKKKLSEREWERKKSAKLKTKKNSFKVFHTNNVRSNVIRVRYGRMFLYGVT